MNNNYLALASEDLEEIYKNDYTDKLHLIDASCLGYFNRGIRYLVLVDQHDSSEDGRYAVTRVDVFIGSSGKLRIEFKGVCSHTSDDLNAMIKAFGAEEYRNKMKK